MIGRMPRIEPSVYGAARAVATDDGATLLELLCEGCAPTPSSSEDACHHTRPMKYTLAARPIADTKSATSVPE